MSAVYEELLAAGAPELPEDYFYRIHYHGLGLVKVGIYRRRKYWFAKNVDYTLYPEYQLKAVENYAVACSLVHGRAKRYIGPEVGTRSELLQRMTGDHP